MRQFWPLVTIETHVVYTEMDFAQMYILPPQMCKNKHKHILYRYGVQNPRQKPEDIAWYKSHSIAEELNG